jgi:hypothetical protein
LAKAGEAPAEQRRVQRNVAAGECARCGVADGLAEAEILEEIAGAGLGHGDLSSRDGGRPALFL